MRSHVFGNYVIKYCTENNMQRDHFVDIAKGLCIFLIIVIHSPLTEVFPLTFIAVPLFFFMSGFYDKEKSFIDTTKICLRKMILPSFYFFCFNYTYIVLRKYLNYHEVIFINIPLVNPAGAVNGPIWFLFALFYTKLLVVFLRQLNINSIYKWIGIILLGYIGSNTHLPLYLSEGMMCLPLYYAGKLYYLNSIYKQKRTLLNILSIVLLILSQLGVFQYQFGINKQPNYGFSYLLSFTAILFSCHCILWLCQSIHSPLIEKIGKNTLGIMLIHSQIEFTLFYIVEKTGYSFNTPLNFIINLSIIICSFIISYLLTLFIRHKVPWLLGEK